MKRLSLKELTISKREIMSAETKLHRSGLKMIKLRGEWFLIERNDGDGRRIIPIVEVNPETFEPMYKIGPYYVPIEPLMDKS